MIRQFRICACACALAACAAAEEAGDAAAEETAEEGATNAAETVARASDDAGFARYRTILDRMPFGPEPENFDPDDPSSGGAGVAGATGAAAAAAEKSAEERQILASVRVSALNVTPSGKIAVGFTDGSRQPAAVYYLKVGESRDGWTVREANADPKEMTVTLERDGVSATLKLGEGTGGGKAAPGRAVARPAVLSQRQPLLQSNAVAPVAPVAVPPPPGAAAKLSPYALLRARQARAAQARQEEAKRREEEAAQAKAEQAAEQERLQAERAQQQADSEAMRTQLKQLAEEVKRATEARQQQPPAAEEEGEPADQTPE